VKGENHSSQLLLACVIETESGVNVQVCLGLGQQTWVYVGPVDKSLSPKRNQSSTSKMHDMFVEGLANLFKESREMFVVDNETSNA
jgi:hypothetical protein